MNPRDHMRLSQKYKLSNRRLRKKSNQNHRNPVDWMHLHLLILHLI
ncbi:hypothetical protein GCK32_011981 [Trichostrongylus colubriformis]|uniref:Uncharacterized protein n=1 Tax=Trichostrongylus colubriformis TaxID=6319 RepID=A0AAN8IKP4_TRICO